MLFELKIEGNHKADLTEKELLFFWFLHCWISLMLVSMCTELFCSEVFTVSYLYFLINPPPKTSQQTWCRIEKTKKNASPSWRPAFHINSGSGSWSNTFIKYWEPDVARYGLDARDWTWSWQKWNPGPCEGIFETKRTGTRPSMASVKWTRSNFIWRTNSIVF